MTASVPGMGAMPLPGGGVAFRVWAKFALNVHVAGEFNQWSETATTLDSEGNGNWSIDVPAARVGQKYRYVIEGQDSVVRWRTDPRALRVDPAEQGNADGSIVAPIYFWNSGSFGMPGFHDLVVYQLHIETFHDRSQPDTFDGLIAKLGHLQDLGVNAIELLPIFGHFGQHALGYNPAFPYDIESNFGSSEGFKQFIYEAHLKGFAVIMDLVYNHFGWEELEYSLRQLDGWQEDGNDGIYFYPHDPRKSGGYGPRPDFGRSEVRDYIRDNVRLWLEQYHVDGFRFDAVTLIRNAHDQDWDPGNDIPEGIELLRDLNWIIKHQPSAKISIAEDLKDNPWIVQKGDGGLGFDSQWASELYWAIHDNVAAAWDWQRSMSRVRDALERGFNTDAFSRIGFTETHDATRADRGHARIPQEISPADPEGWHAKKRSTLGAGLVLTSKCIPMLFQEQELLAGGAWAPDRHFDWSRRQRLDGIFRLFCDLVRLRRNRYRNTQGLRGHNVHVHHVNEKDKVIAFHRWDRGGPGDDVVVVLNFGCSRFDTYSLGMPAHGLWWCRFNSDARTYDETFGDFGSPHTFAEGTDPGDPDHMPCRARIGIAPYSMLIFSQ